MNLDHLRLTVGLASAMPGSSLTLRCLGDELIASESPCADIELCVMRQVVMASCLPCQPNHVRHITSVEFGNGVVDLGRGIVFDEATGSHWFGSFLHPATVVELASDLIPRDRSFSIRPDPGLGVCLVRFDHGGETPSWPVYQLAQTLHELCLRRELRNSIERVGQAETFDVAGGFR